jgi:hypothetical protein
LQNTQQERALALGLFSEGTLTYGKQAGLYGLTFLDNPVAKNATPLAFVADNWNAISDWSNANGMERLSLGAGSLNAVTNRNPLSKIMGDVATNVSLRAFDETLTALNTSLRELDLTSNGNGNWQRTESSHERSWRKTVAMIDRISSGETETLDEFAARLERELDEFQDWLEKAEADNSNRLSERAKLSRALLPKPAPTARSPGPNSTRRTTSTPYCGIACRNQCLTAASNWYSRQVAHCRNNGACMRPYFNRLKAQERICEEKYRRSN